MEAQLEERIARRNRIAAQRAAAATQAPAASMQGLQGRVRQIENPTLPLPPRTPWGREDEPVHDPPRPQKIGILRPRLTRLSTEFRSVLKWLGGTGPMDDVVLPQRDVRATPARSFSRVFTAGSNSASAWPDRETRKLAHAIRKGRSAEAEARQLAAVAKNVSATAPVTTEDVMTAAEHPTRTTRFRSGWFLHPLGLPRLTWDGFVLLCLMYCGLVRAAFSVACCTLLSHGVVCFTFVCRLRHYGLASASPMRSI